MFNVVACDFANKEYVDIKGIISELMALVLNARC